MKKLILTVALFLSMIGYANSQSAVDKVKQFASESDYVQAAQFIPQAIKDNYKDVDFLITCGDIYFEIEKYAEALDVYKKADDRDGGNTKIMRRIGKTLSYLGKHDEAIRYLKVATKDHSKDVYLVLELAYAYIKADSLNQAELIVTRAREMNSKIPDAFIALGDLYFAQRVYALARENYEEALSLNDKLIDARTKLAISYYWLANKEIDPDLSNELFARSLKEWNIVTQQDPKNARAWFEQGKILYFSKKFDLSAQSFYKYAQLRPEGYLGRWYLSQALYEIGKCDSAAPHLLAVSENIDSVKSKAKLMLARCYFENKDYPKAAAEFEKLKESQVLDVLDMKRLASSLLLTGDTVKFIKIYRDAIELYPNETCDDMYKLGKTLLKMKQYSTAIELFKKRLSTPNCQDKLEAEINYWLAVSIFLIEKKEEEKTPMLNEAKAYIEKSISLDSTNYMSYIYLGDISAALGDIKNSEIQFNHVISKAVADTAANAGPLNQAFAKLCGLKLEAKKFPEIVKIAGEWAKLYGTTATPFLYLAIGYQGQSDVENACKNYRKALQIDPKNATAKKYLADLGCK